MTSSKLDFRVDSSNLQSDHTRNILRLQIIPAIANEFSQAQNKILEFVESLKSLVDDILPAATEISDEIQIPAHIPVAILKIWIYEHIQKRLAILHDLAINEEAFVNISDKFSVRRSKAC